MDFNKVYADGLGKESPTEMNELVEISIVGEDGKELLKVWKRFGSGKTTWDISLAQSQARLFWIRMDI